MTIDRNQIADELLRDVPDESREDHEAIADAIRRGDAAEQILAMPETDRWPETYSWLKGELGA